MAEFAPTRHVTPLTDALGGATLLRLPMIGGKRCGTKLSEAVVCALPTRFGCRTGDSANV